MRELFAKGKSSGDTWKRITRSRAQQGVGAPTLRAIQRARKAQTYKHGRPETRGRKRALSTRDIDKLDNSRLKLIRKAGGTHEVTIPQVMSDARIKVHRSTAARALAARGVSWRKCREKPPRTQCQRDARREVCRLWRRKPSTYWTDTVDIIIDCKRFAIPTSQAARDRMQSQRVRGVLRTRGEGLANGFTKPNVRKHKFNPGGYVHILAGVCGDKFIVWEVIRGTWTGAQASAMYGGAIAEVLGKARPDKATWLILEDNDPTGFKSTAGKQAKEANGMRALDMPAYSPDLNPLEYSLWGEIEMRVAASVPQGRESKAQFIKRLRRTALRLPRPLVRRAVQSLSRRADWCFAADGGDFAED